MWCRKGVVEEIAGLNVDHAVEPCTSIAAGQQVDCMLGGSWHGFAGTTRSALRHLPTREAGDEMYKKLPEEAKHRDANDTLWGIEAVMASNNTKISTI
jgi:hypothetical protein